MYFTYDDGEEDEHADFPYDPEITDFAFIVGKKKFHVAKVVLMDASPVFRKMFTGDFKEKNVKEMKLPGEDVSTFELFLKCIYPRDYTFTHEQVWKLLPLADEYNVKCILEKCETWLLGQLRFKTANVYVSHYKVFAETIDYLMDCIYYSEKYGLKKLYDSALEKTTPYKFQKYMHYKNYQLLSEKSKRELLETRLQAIEKASKTIKYSIKNYGGTEEIETVSIPPSLFQ